MRVYCLSLYLSLTHNHLKIYCLIVKYTVSEAFVVFIWDYIYLSLYFFDQNV